MSYILDKRLNIRVVGIFYILLVIKGSHNYLQNIVVNFAIYFSVVKY